MVSLLFISQTVLADEPAKVDFQSFKSFGDAVVLFKDKGKLPKLSGNIYSGYSLLPFGSRKKAWADAQSNAEKDGVSVVVISTDGEREYEPGNIPPGASWYGTFAVITLSAVTPVDLTQASLLDAIKSNGVGYFMETAKKPEFKGMTKDYREIVRANNNPEPEQGRRPIMSCSENTNYNLHLKHGNEINRDFNLEKVEGLSCLTQLITLHDGKTSGDDLLKWAKYHKNANVRLQAMLGLIEFGRTAEVEEVLKTETNNEVKTKVQKNLI